MEKRRVDIRMENTSAYALFSDKEFERLSCDFLQYLNLGKPQGGKYECAHIYSGGGHDHEEGTIIILKFSQITLIQATPDAKLKV